MGWQRESHNPSYRSQSGHLVASIRIVYLDYVQRTPGRTRRKKGSNVTTKPTAVIRTGQPPLKFDGVQLATASSKKDGSRHEAKQWYEAAIHRTKAGGYVATAVYRTQWCHEREYRWATAHGTASEAILWLQKLDVLGVVAGFPDGAQFEHKQERLMDSLQDQWDWLVGELLGQCGDEFAEVIQ